MDRGSSPDFTFKIFLIGDSAVGKSSLFSRFARDEFDPHVRDTRFASKRLTIGGKTMTIRVRVLGMPDLEHTSVINLVTTFKKAGALLVYDITRHSTYVAATRWLKGVKDRAEDHIPITLVGNKSDLEHQRAVPVNEAREFAATNNLSFIETSARDSSNLESALRGLLANIYRALTGESLEGLPEPEPLVNSLPREGQFYPPVAMQESIWNSILTGSFIDAKIFAYTRCSRESGRIHTPKALFVNTHVLANACGYFRSTFDLSDGVETHLTAWLPAGFDAAIDMEENGLDTQILPERAVRAYLVKYTPYRTLRAIIWYIYSGEINFSSTDPSGPPTASPESIYQFAEEHGIDYLKALAFEKIAETIREMEEPRLIQTAFSPFASRYPHIRDVYIQKLRHFLGNGPNEAFRGQLYSYLSGEFPCSKDLLTSLLQVVMDGPTISTPPANDRHSTIQRVSLPWPETTKIALLNSLDHGTFEDTHVTFPTGSGSAGQQIYLAEAVDGRVASVSQLCRSGLMSQCNAEISHSTLQAIVYYLYTNRISFKPLGFRGFNLDYDLSDPRFRGCACSLREVLYITCKLNTCDALADLATNEIASQLTPENVVEEVFWDSSAPTRITERGVEIIRENRGNAQIRSKLQRLLEEAASGDRPVNNAAIFACFTELLRRVGPP